jgi:hypothetical protein
MGEPSLRRARDCLSFLSENHEAAALSIVAAISKAREIGDVGFVIRRPWSLMGSSNETV